MTSKYTSESGHLVQSDISSYRKVRGYLSASITSNDKTSSTISWTVEAQFKDAYLYGVEVICNINGKDVGSDEGYLTSDPGNNWKTAASKSGTTKITKKTTEQTIPIKITVRLKAVNDYGGNYGSYSTSFDLTVSALDDYIITYRANGGQGSIVEQKIWYDTSATLKSSNAFTKTGYTLSSWNTKDDGSGTKYNVGGKYAFTNDIVLYAIWTPKTYTVTLDAGNGKFDSGESTATINATYDAKYGSFIKPTYAGRTFDGWYTSSSSNTFISPADTVKITSDTTFYAHWTENTLTVNYYSNNATTAFEGALNEVGAGKNVPVKIQKFLYDNTYENGLDNYSTPQSGAYMARIGYSPLGIWSTEVDGSGINIGEFDTFATGEDHANAFGLSLVTDSKSVNVYPQWEENKLTVKYYSNFATNAFAGALNEVGADKNVIVREDNFLYGTAYEYGLHDYAKTEDSTYLSRTRYNAVDYWGTSEEVYTKEDKNDEDGIISNANGIAVHSYKSFDSGQALAEAFGLSLENESQTINLYAQWELGASVVTMYDSNGNKVKGTICFTGQDGSTHFGIITVYDASGNPHTVI